MIFDKEFSKTVKAKFSNSISTDCIRGSGTQMDYSAARASVVKLPFWQDLRVQIIEEHTIQPRWFQ